MGDLVVFGGEYGMSVVVPELDAEAGHLAAVATGFEHAADQVRRAFDALEPALTAPPHALGCNPPIPGGDLPSEEGRLVAEQAASVRSALEGVKADASRAQRCAAELEESVRGCARNYERVERFTMTHPGADPAKTNGWTMFWTYSKERAPEVLAWTPHGFVMNKLWRDVWSAGKTVVGLWRNDPPGLAESAKGVASAADLLGEASLEAWLLSGGPLRLAQEGLPPAGRGPGGPPTSVLAMFGWGLAEGVAPGYFGPEAKGPIAVEKPVRLPEGPGGKKVHAEGAPQVPRGSLEELMELQRASEEADGTQGALLVTRRVGADGEETWIVTVPGTRVAPGTVWGPGRLVEAIPGETKNVGPAVTNALRLAGAPAGAKVLLNGHSQGGAHATNLASDPTLRGRYTVQGVFTAGAPTGARPTPPGVKVLHLENVTDPVPGLDSKIEVPVSRDRVVVRDSAPRPEVPEGQDGGVFSTSHAVDNYARTAREVQASDDLSLKQSLRDLGIATDARSQRNTSMTTWKVTTVQGSK